MSLYVRHAAWLATVPERAKNDTFEGPRLSRLETLRIDSRKDSRKDRREEDYQPEMPPLDGAAYLLGYLFEVGPTMAAGMGAAPITHTELRAWMDLTGVRIAPWEVRTLRRLSHDYLVASREAEKINCRPPWQPNGDAPDVSAVATGIQTALRNLANL